MDSPFNQPFSTAPTPYTSSNMYGPSYEPFLETLDAQSQLQSIQLSAGRNNGPPRFSMAHQLSYSNPAPLPARPRLTRPQFQLRNPGQNSLYEINMFEARNQTLYQPPNRTQRRKQARNNGVEMERCVSQTGSQSTCCSSCPDGEACADPDCSVPSVSHDTPNCADNHVTTPSSYTDASKAGQKNDGYNLAANCQYGMQSPQISARNSNLNSTYNLDAPYQNGSQNLGHSNFFETSQAGASSLMFSNMGAGLVNNNNHSQIPSGLNGQPLDEYMAHCNWTDCNQFLSNQDEFNQHVYRQHVDPQMMYPCPVKGPGQCGELPENQLFPHLQAHHPSVFQNDSGSLSCPTHEDQTFHDFSMFEEHLGQVHPLAYPLQCGFDECHTIFTKPRDFLEHLNIQHAVPPPCPSSSSKGDEIMLDDSTRALEKAGSMHSLLRNEESNGHDPHQCRWTTAPGMSCGHKFTNEKELHGHIKEAHLSKLKKESGYICLWEGCDRAKKREGQHAGFTQKGKLERHMATHSNYKSAQCPECGELFSAEQSMKQHLRLHTGEKPFKCKHCPKTFPQQSACTIHERTHTKEKPLKCNICNARFSESSNLAKHRKTHGEKGIHVCTIPGCDKSFHRSDQLKRHVKSHEHRIKKLQQRQAAAARGEPVGSEYESTPTLTSTGSLSNGEVEELVQEYDG
ncbi:hypothetical protein B0J14DRAFT_534634 [Halenospora varia]|nr:hypothetical protein B0J14DRAFT_534634 [Halenospora varia]